MHSANGPVQTELRICKNLTLVKKVKNSPDLAENTLMVGKRPIVTTPKINVTYM